MGIQIVAGALAFASGFAFGAVAVRLYQKRKNKQNDVFTIGK